MHGEGKMRWPDGRSYEGCFHDDLKDGFGTFRWPDGRSYAGSWLTGLQHGTGVFTDAEGHQRAVLMTRAWGWEVGFSKL